MTGQLPEAEQNALLRRADWRFLIDVEHEPRSLCSDDERLARAVELISAPSDGRLPFELAVLANPGSRDLRAAWEALEPGGEIYVEWRRPRLAGAALARRRLRAAGFTAVRLYWPWPPPARRPPSFWLPLDSPRALAWFLRSRPRPAGRGGRRRGLVALWRLACSAGAVAPLCAVARKGPRSTAALSVGDESPLLLLTGGEHSSNKVVGLVFGQLSTEPEFVVKFARSSAQDEPLHHEARVLTRLEEERPQLSGVPRVRSLARRSGRVALAESPVRGVDALPRLTRDSFGEIAPRVVDWLVELAGRAPAEPRVVWWDRLVEEPTAWFERAFAPVIESAEKALVWERLGLLPDLPIVVEHRDCAPWNILLDGGAISLVDWESAEPMGLPGLDLVYFLTHGALLVDGALATGRAPASYRQSLDPDSPTGQVVRRCERRYCDGVGLDWAVLHPLRLLCWIVHSRSEHGRLGIASGREAVGEPLRRSLFLDLWREELARETPQTS